MFKKKVFSLIEIMIVMLIIGFILYISILYLLQFLQSVRNTERITTVKMFVSSLEVYFKNNLKYPLPDQAEDISCSVLNTDIFRQGIVGSGFINNLKGISKIPIDTIYGHYKYSLNVSGTIYQLLIPLEGEEEKNYIEGNYKGFLLAITGGKDFLIKLPSMFLAQGNVVSTGTKFLVNSGVISLSGLLYSDVTWYYVSGYDYNKLLNLSSYFNVDVDFLDSILKTINGYVFFLDNKNVYPYNFNK